jgi:hypothetical protein
MCDLRGRRDDVHLQFTARGLDPQRAVHILRDDVALSPAGEQGGSSSIKLDPVVGRDGDVVIGDDDVHGSGRHEGLTKLLGHYKAPSGPSSLTEVPAFDKLFRDCHVKPADVVVVPRSLMLTFDQFVHEIVLATSVIQLCLKDGSMFVGAVLSGGHLDLLLLVRGTAKSQAAQSSA